MLAAYAEAIAEARAAALLAQVGEEDTPYAAYVWYCAGEADLATTFDNLRQITDNLRDLTEDAKRYPSNLLFGAPPQPLGHKP